LERQIWLDKQAESVAISAIQSKTLKPLVEKIGELVGNFALSDLQVAIGK
jgi:hypothetical protein